ncbi:MAG: N-acetyl-gamma-glutamyl-phosphate reductase [Cyanobacteria bacterium REEB446]|nr:N-acetyl-gamma-glutamyl-phosphate reductase [Cyanobacteria bacterium REEB446]
MKIAILGSTGYTGVKLIELLLNHPFAEIVFISSEQYQDRKFSEIYPAFINIFDQICLSTDELIDNTEKYKPEVIFFATPNGIALKHAHIFIEKGIHVIDLSADYRFKDLKTHFKYYAIERHNPLDLSLNKLATYGLCESYSAEKKLELSSKKAQLIANPGCYTTASILSVLPLIALHQKNKDILDLSSFIIDAKSGVSGAGRKASTAHLFTEINESFKPYNLAHKHRHTPELEEFFSIYSSDNIKLTFSPHLIPITSGLLATSYLKFKQKPNQPESFLRDIYINFYKDSHFIRILPENEYPNTKWACGTNNAFIQIDYDPISESIIATCAIDNTIKGASGQAIQNMNILFGLTENLGLDLKPRMI